MKRRVNRLTKLKVPETHMPVFMKALALFVIVVALSHPASSQSPERWVGTWHTEFGEVRLQNTGNFVYGDYGEIGIIEGVATVDGNNNKYLRARFERFNGYVGYVEWRIREYEGEGQLDGLRGKYDRADRTFPSTDEDIGSRWNGEKISNDRPTFTSYQGSGSVIDFMSVHGAAVGSWMGANSIRSRTTSPWAGTWDTSYGEVRLRQIGSGDAGVVYGDYGITGTIIGYRRLVDGKHLLRARFDRKDGGSGYIEWASKGPSDNELEGRWHWVDQPLPEWNGTKGGVWTATRISVQPPNLTTFIGTQYDIQEMIGSDATYREWIQFKTPQAEPEPAEVVVTPQERVSATPDETLPMGSYANSCRYCKVLNKFGKRVMECECNREVRSPLTAQIDLDFCGGNRIGNHAGILYCSASGTGVSGSFFDSCLDERIITLNDGSNLLTADCQRPRRLRDGAGVRDIVRELDYLGVGPFALQTFAADVACTIANTENKRKGVCYFVKRRGYDNNVTDIRACPSKRYWNDGGSLKCAG